ncbi:penicillin acylase family protein [Intrasporangium calvum]|uniref:Peptidase S45 penicillin amidase n=1 Tax=Intrasporangium calvum (strain ATCC 23552 / DSM 43043 / JCM 3097 / NBRC 12989 / NCIMB 10167 / NRRL B-3866 / 7 KIP) TaxID=710696 RepID=E6SC72_INTC7|nr:penicillin acylase family protein [Intrasporangium calvum]ADU47416.1 peptidase S45 penicillin amidase [Intrasporangium calvum DSM 43043]
MPRAHLARRIALSVVVLVIVALVALTILAVSTVRRPFPETTGELEVEGLTGRVTVSRDARGVPTITADSANDLFRAQGYVSAQDRFFEMDLRRHITAGRLSELVGEGGLDTDRVIRTMGWRRVAEQELPRLAPETRQYLQAYADGVNAYLKQADSPADLALEYQVLDWSVPGYRVEPWTPVDSLAWLKAMAWDLKADYEDELARARLSRGGRTSQKQIELLYPPYPFDRNQPILSEQDWRPGAAASDQQAAAATPMALLKGGQGAFDATAAAMAAIPALIGEGDGVGSNSWVVSGDRTTTGKPLLANDPHLSLGIPSIWTQVNLQCRTVSAQCPFQVSGFSFSGLPGVVIGHNAKVAWGFTNLGADVTDFYLEQVSGDTYLRDGNQEPLETRRETIKVAGGSDVEILVRSTVHGPILSDAVPAIAESGDQTAVRGVAQSNRYAVSLAWTALTPTRTADAIFALNTATGWDDFRSAAALFAVPAQNLVYADTDGHIGYQTPGLFPVRRSATPGAVPGSWPSPGWDSQWDWRGFVDFEELPYVLDPQEGFIVTANQAVTASQKPFLTGVWDYGFRAERIRTLLAGSAKVSPERMVQIQGDTRNAFAPVLVEHLLGVEVDDFTAQAQLLLRDWDGNQPADKTRDSASAAYYNAVWKHLLEYTFDELPPDMAASGGTRWMIVLEQLLKDPKNAWWDDKTTPGVTEGSGEILKRALVDARLDLARKLGKVPATWRWGRLHQLNLEHRVLGTESVPGVIRDVFNRGGIELGGGNGIVNATSWDASSSGYEVTAGPSMRMVVDLSDLDRSLWVNATGQSGHAYNSHYADQIDAWAANEPFPWPFTARAVAAAQDSELTLVPPGQPTG